MKRTYFRVCLGCGVVDNKSEISFNCYNDLPIQSYHIFPCAYEDFYLKNQDQKNINEKHAHTFLPKKKVGFALGHSNPKYRKVSLYNTGPKK